MHCWNVPGIDPAIAIVEFGDTLFAELSRLQSAFDSDNNANFETLRFEQPGVEFYRANNMDLRGVYADLEGTAWAISDTEFHVPAANRLSIGRTLIGVASSGFLWIADLPQFGKETHTIEISREFFAKQFA